MKRHEGAGLLPALVLLAALAACGVSGGPVSGGMNPTGGPAPEAPALEETAPEEEPCVHQAPQGDNVIEHEAAGCCGSTVTTVSRETRMGNEPWAASVRM